VILGAPNSGKSSLFNALIERDAAIVTSEAGTTRDLLEVSLDLKGTLVRVTDTAGIRDGAGLVEAIGIERAQARAGEADLILVLEDMRTPIGFELGPVNAPLLKVGTKSDLIEDGLLRGQNKLYDIMISTIDGSGITDLLDEIGRRAAGAISPAADVLPSRMRHVELLRETLRYLGEAVDTAESPLELRSEALRLAGHALGRIAGSVDVEDLLEVIFSQFCIGK
jgi:tRNA modification GTPase